MLIPFLFLLAFFAAIVGVIRPYKGLKRWHFAVGSLATLFALGATVPAPTPEEIAARKAAEAKELAEEKASEAGEIADKARGEHDKIVAKAGPALEVPTNYTKSEYGQTLARVGSATFAKLNSLEPGAAYAAAESRECNRVSTAMVSDTSKRGAAMWFVDCENGNRFMVDQPQAIAALERFKAGTLAATKLEASCTINSVAMCKATPAQKKGLDQEVQFVSACDLILQQVVTSPSSLDMQGRWSTEFGPVTPSYFAVLSTVRTASAR